MLIWSRDDSYHVCWIEFILWIQVSKSYFKIYFWCAGEKVLTRDKRLSFHVSWSIALIDICFRSPYKTFLTPLRKVYDGSSSRFISTHISALPIFRKFPYLNWSWWPGKITIYLDAKKKTKLINFRQREVSSSIVAIIIFGIRTGNGIVY